jgi:predicted P-loop ATPase
VSECPILLNLRRTPHPGPWRSLDPKYEVTVYYSRVKRGTMKLGTDFRLKIRPCTLNCRRRRRRRNRRATRTRARWFPRRRRRRRRRV